MFLINCKINLNPNWSKKCVIVSTDVAGQCATLLTNDTRLYVPVVPLSIQDDVKLI